MTETFRTCLTSSAVAARVGVPVDELAGVLDAYEAAREHVERWTAARDELRVLVERVLGDAEIGTVGGRVRVRFTHVTSRVLDQRKLRESEPEVYARYTLVRQTRRFTTVDPPGSAQPDGGLCRSCGAPILWAETVHGRVVPVDPLPVAGGNVALLPRTGQRPVASVNRPSWPGPWFVSHFATCPHAGAHRRNHPAARQPAARGSA